MTTSDKTITLNEYQSDVVLATLRTEVTRIKAEKSMPESLKLLAVRELTGVIDQLGSVIATPPTPEGN